MPAAVYAETGSATWLSFTFFLSFGIGALLGGGPRTTYALAGAGSLAAAPLVIPLFRALRQRATDDETETTQA